MLRCLFSDICKWFDSLVFSDKDDLLEGPDLSQTSHCNIKGVSVSEVMRIENEITPVKFY